MARIYPLFSSSKGNCFFFGNAEGGIIIDCGVSCKRICDALKMNGLPLSAVKAVFITHTHSDHVSGARVFLKKLHSADCGTHLYAQMTNLSIMHDKGMLSLPEDYIHALDGEAAVSVGGFTVSHFITPHDTPASCGFRVVFPDGKTAALCTDLGHITEEIRAGITGCDLVVLESNYDPDMLWKGIYPPELKQRITSGRGHLSNVQCGEMLRELAAGGTRKFVLAHISPENNTPAVAAQAALAALAPLEHGKDYLLYTAPEENGGAIVF